MMMVTSVTSCCSSGTGCWYAGTVVGLQHAWLRHPAPGGEVWPPDLSPAWQHRTGLTWSTEDTTLRVEALPGQYKHHS